MNIICNISGVPRIMSMYALIIHLTGGILHILSAETINPSGMENRRVRPKIFSVVPNPSKRIGRSFDISTDIEAPLIYNLFIILLY